MKNVLVTKCKNVAHDHNQCQVSVSRWPMKICKLPNPSFWGPKTPFVNSDKVPYFPIKVLGPSWVFPHHSTKELLEVPVVRLAKFANRLRGEMLSGKPNEVTWFWGQQKLKFFCGEEKSLNKNMYQSSK